LQTTFARSWSDLEADINKITFTATGAPSHAAISDTDSTKTAAILEELLSLGRSQMNILRSPEELLPPRYVRLIMREASASTMPRSHPMWLRISERIDAIGKLLDNLPDDQKDAANILLRELTTYFHYLRQRFSRPYSATVERENISRYILGSERELPANVTDEESSRALRGPIRRRRDEERPSSSEQSTG
jgi:hypothetical protein